MDVSKRFSEDLKEIYRPGSTEVFWARSVGCVQWDFSQKNVGFPFGFPFRPPKRGIPTPEDNLRRQVFCERLGQVVAVWLGENNEPGVSHISPSDPGEWMREPPLWVWDMATHVYCGCDFRLHRSGTLLFKPNLLTFFGFPFVATTFSNVPTGDDLFSS